ncbi:Probable RNA-directed DNA polymerase from transposon X-element [Eumeta japonica]|uniref:Probable RNA-directed DNA polymerase from transposon X-element n=1 Tax=Eumeta variegata TaxID=151549 RepID=A0A4C1YRZ2_EUMVA|nr:Probable RNA-directed DNA polymerase from transposon X-element [Eumeta japonica]
MEEIRLSHKAFWKITKALKTEGIPIPPQRPDGTTALTTRERSPVAGEITQNQKGTGPRWCGGNRHPQARASRPPASYRPISLLSGLAKLFERVLKTRLSNHLFGKGLIIDEQFGFRPAHSCPQQVLRLVEYVMEGFKTKQKTVAVFFDVAKAFDRVWHAGLVYKLYSLEVPDRLIFIIQNFLSNRYFTFRHERTHSTRRLIRAGVPQGSALSPLLYSAYTNDIPRPTSGVQLALFADDTALFFRSRTRRSIFRHLPKAIDELGQWFRKWRIEVNPDKSAAIQFKYSKNRSQLVVDRNTQPQNVERENSVATVL